MLVLVPQLGGPIAWRPSGPSRLAGDDRLGRGQAGWPVVVGSRAGAWAPVPQLAAAVVLDAHDAAYREESGPTYSAVEVLLERARREGAPALSSRRSAGASDRRRRRAAGADRHPRAGGLAHPRAGRSPGCRPAHRPVLRRFVRLAHRCSVTRGSGADETPLVCVYNRTGGARLLACAHCGELARCARCGAAAAKDRGTELLACPRCGETRLWSARPAGACA